MRNPTILGIYGNPKDKTKRNTLISPIQYRGLEMIDLESKSKGNAGKLDT